VVRVVSLVPSATETLLAWGVVPVGVTRWCGHPELGPLGGTKDPDVGAVVALAPDVVVLCDEENRREDADALDAAGIPTHVIRIRTVADVAPELAALARRVGVAVEPAPPLPVVVPSGRRAFVPIWRERGPGGSPATFTTLNDDTYGASVLAALGLANAYGDATDRYPTTTLAEAAARGADVVVAPSEPYPFGPRHVDELAAVAPVVLVDGQDLFWWGVRTPGALARLGDVLRT
jgi:ABC-type Fe3+-hydroxamate transport system substrate-binding protein